MPDLTDDLGHEERDDVEWKRDAEDRDVLRKAVCALANDLPVRGRGHLIIGVRNDGTPTGLNVDDELLLRVTNIRDEAKVLPRPVISVAKATFAGADCVHVTVEAAKMRPVRLDGAIWVRVGTSTRRATREEEVLLTERTRAGDLTFDQHPVAGSGIGDLDVELFRSAYLRVAVDPEVMAQNDRTADQQLASLGMLDPANGEARVLGLLVVGLDPSAVIPGAYIQFVRFEGSDEASNVIDQEDLRGNLVGQLDVLAHLLTANIRTAVREVDGMRQADQPDYPLNALRELVLNAVTHRDYEHFHAPVRILWFEDRIEITSPGGPFGVVTKDTFDRRNDYRNPALAAAMKTLGYVNRFGRGITLVRVALKKNGNPPADFQVEDSYWSVTLRRYP
ncbi:MAG: ATP-binding protein [Acidimicrobiales bacterium]